MVYTFVEQPALFNLFINMAFNSGIPGEKLHYMILQRNFHQSENSNKQSMPKNFSYDALRMT